MTRQKLFLWIQALLCVLLCVMLAASAVSIFAEGMQVREAGDVTAWIFTREKVAERLMPVLPVAAAAAVMTVVGLLLGIRGENQDKPVKAGKRPGSGSAKRTLGGNMSETPGETSGEAGLTGGRASVEAGLTGRKAHGESGLTGIRAALLILAVVLIVYGVFNGSMRDVLYKAIKICTECVGLG